MPKALCSLNVADLERYSTKLFTLIPLHHYTRTSTIIRKGEKFTRKDGKRPVDSVWSVKDYKSARTLEAARQHGNNVGVRLTSDQLVIDVDPRNGGAKGFDDLCAALRIDRALYPTVITGSGGLHLYMRKPPALLIVDTLKKYPGVEFKSKGRQVVAAGSIHPDTLTHYEWDALAPAIEDGLPDAPERLLNVIARPDREVTIKGGGQLTQEEVAEKLLHLDPCDFREHGDWLAIMMACHHASNGDARSEFVEWSTSDPNYANDAELIGRRWDSCHTEKNDGYTYKTLNKALREHGAAEAQVVDEDDRASDFDELADAAGDDMDFETPAPREKEKAKSKLPGGKSVDEDDGVKPENPGGFDDASQALLDELNATYATVEDGGKFRVIFQKFEPVLKRSSWVRMAPTDFMLMYSNKRVERTSEELEKLSRGAAPTAPLGKSWIEWIKRKHYKGLIFDPKKDADHPGSLNTWTGFAYGTGEDGGSWEYLNELLFEVLAEGNETNHAYILNWLRYLFQYPERRAECAIVFKGGKGVGKGTLGNAITRLIGHHAISVGSAALITGRFNSHFQDLLFLFADEAVKPHDKVGESQLKNLITEPLVAYEGKGRDVVQGPNFLHVMMASNEQWVVPASPDERRYFVTECSTKYQRNKSFFDKLHAELNANDDSGYRQFLWDLLTTPTPAGFHPRDYPLTAALVDQKVRSQTPLAQFFFDALNEGVTPFKVIKGNWEKDRVRIFTAEFRDTFATWQRERGINVGAMGRGNMRFVFQELQQLFPSANTELRAHVSEEWLDVIQASPSDGRAQAIELPPMSECKAFFRESLGGDCFSPTKTDFDFG